MNEPERFTPETVGRVVRWVIIIFLAYVFLQNITGLIPGSRVTETANQPVTPQAATTNAKTESKDCEGSVFNNFSLFAMPLFPTSASSVSVSDITVGSGAALMCGQKATLRYAYARRGGDVIFSNMDSGPETKDVLIGGREIIPGLERGVIDMKVGGERDITIPPELGFAAINKMETLRDHEKFKFGGITSFLTARAKLISVSPEFPQSPLKLRMVEQTLGDGRAFECGDDVSIILSLWKMDGTRIYSNEGGEALRFTLGKSQMPFGIEQGLLGMMPEGRRTLIIPPAYTKPLFENAENALLKDVAFENNEIMLATVQIVSPTAAAKPTEPKPTEPKE